MSLTSKSTCAAALATLEPLEFEFVDLADEREERPTSDVAPLSDLDRRLDESGFQGHFFIVQSNGGVMTSTAAETLPVRTALSGPAAGAPVQAAVQEEPAADPGARGTVEGSDHRGVREA